MNRLFGTANHYYTVLERFGFRNLVKSAWAWLWVLFAIALVWRVVIFFARSSSSNGSSQVLSAEFAWLICLELMVLLLSFKLQSQKKMLVLERINKRYHQSFSCIPDARRFLLRKFLGKNESEYLDFLNEIQRASDYQKELSGPFNFSFSRIMNLIYDSTSKQNIYALLLAIASLLAALLISEGGGITAVFAFFSGETLSSVLLVWLMVTFFLGFLLLILLFVRHGLESTAAYISVRLDGRTARSLLTLRYLQRDLLAFHRFIALRA